MFFRVNIIWTHELCLCSFAFNFQSDQSIENRAACNQRPNLQKKSQQLNTQPTTKSTTPKSKTTKLILIIWGSNFQSTQRLETSVWALVGSNLRPNQTSTKSIWALSVSFLFCTCVPNLGWGRTLRITLGLRWVQTNIQQHQQITNKLNLFCSISFPSKSKFAKQAAWVS